MLYIDENGNPSDRGLVDEPLVNEDEIRECLIRAGVIKEIVCTRINNNQQKETDMGVSISVMSLKYLFPEDVVKKLETFSDYKEPEEPVLGLMRTEIGLSGWNALGLGDAWRGILYLPASRIRSCYIEGEDFSIEPLEGLRESLRDIAEDMNLPTEVDAVRAIYDAGPADSATNAYCVMFLAASEGLPIFVSK